jgi:hypothetical protein
MKNSIESLVRVDFATGLCLNCNECDCNGRACLLPATTATDYVRVNVRTIIVGQNHEMADMANPEGNVYGERIEVEAHTEEGRCFVHNLPARTEEEAQAFADKVLAAGEFNEDHWYFSRISYGSPGWDAQELDNEIRDAFDAGERHPMG